MGSLGHLIKGMGRPAAVGQIAPGIANKTRDFKIYIDIYDILCSPYNTLLWFYRERNGQPPVSLGMLVF